MSLTFAIVGGGPAGLYFARLRKLAHPQDRVVVYEQNETGVTYGFGVSIAGQALSRYELVDPDLTRAIAAASLPLRLQRFTLEAESLQTSLVGSVGGSIERQVLLDIMENACRDVGVEIRHGARIDGLAGIEADVVIGADGANSLVLAGTAQHFRPRYGTLGNRFAWYGVRRVLPEAGLAFRRRGGNLLVAHYYPYAAGLSTFVAEVDRATWEAGFGALSDAERKAIFEEAFAWELGGDPLIENRSIWRQFRFVENERWQHGNRVLLGDALAVAHYSIGSGTRLAMDDALALFDAFEDAGDDVRAALQLFEERRRPVRAKLTTAARRSWDWYEDIARHIRLPLLDFIDSFMSRTGRMDDARLARSFPELAAALAERETRVAP